MVMRTIILQNKKEKAGFLSGLFYANEAGCLCCPNEEGGA
jgi:hypothetical protein